MSRHKIIHIHLIWFSAQPNPVLLTINTPVLNRDICNGVAIHMGRVGESMLCAGNVAQNIGVCPATQGGGLICTVNNQNLFVGVLTGGFGCGAANSPGIYTQVRSHKPYFRFENFITALINYLVTGENPSSMDSSTIQSSWYSSSWSNTSPSRC